MFNTPQEICADIARELTENPASWTQHAEARDSTGEEVAPYSPAAVCWCARGHICKRLVPGWPLNEQLRGDTIQALSRQARATDLLLFSSSMHIAEWNDHSQRTAAGVAAAFRAVADSLAPLVQLGQEEE